jgi:hypothetical protein
MPRPAFDLLLQPRHFPAGLTGALGFAGLCIALLSWLPAMAQAPAPAQTAPAQTAPAPVAATASAPASATGRASPSKAAASAAKSNNNNKRVTKPLWSELAPAQQQALAPLAGTWNTVSDAQKRKWLALSQNYPAMSGAEQSKLHSRMSEWASLSPQQRTEARLNFGETKKLSPDDKKAKWEAYQALPAEEKRQLAASAPKPPVTAAAVKPVPPEKLADIPKPKRVAKTTPRIAAEPGQVDHNTLLPQPSPPLGAGRSN